MYPFLVGNKGFNILFWLEKFYKNLPSWLHHNVLEPSAALTLDTSPLPPANSKDTGSNFNQLVEKKSKVEKFVKIKISNLQHLLKSKPPLHLSPPYSHTIVAGKRERKQFVKENLGNFLKNWD